MECCHLDPQETALRLKTDLSRGLSRREAARRLEDWGPNEIRREKKHNLFLRFLEQFRDPMVLILLAAAAVSFGVARLQGEGFSPDPVIILAIVVCNAVVGTVQEARADHAIEALRGLSSPHAAVIRDGKRREIPAADLVPGDLVLLKAGDLAPADLRLIKSVGLRVGEAVLTGESVPSEKDAQALCPQHSLPAAQKNMIFAATEISSGAGAGIVTATGMHTAVGKIAGMLEEESAPQTPLQRRLNQTGKLLGLGVLALCGIVFLLGMLRGSEPLDMFLLAVSLGVAAIPEGLTAVVTIVLAIGVRRMAARRAIVRRLPAVEALGCTQVICSDKTGTLTENRMTVVAFCGPFGEEPLEGEAAAFALELASLCSDTRIQAGRVVGDPTETALTAACPIAKEELERRFPRIGELPFSSERKRMTTAHRLDDGRCRIICKGAPDVLLARCDRLWANGTESGLSGGQRARILADNSALADRALRVLAVAYRDCPGPSPDDEENESHLVFCGLIAMEDPPRAGVAESVACCKEAGIVPVMITGDHASTALAIARRIGIAKPGDAAVTGDELERMGDEELSKKLSEEDCRVFARVSPAHKSKIVRAFQRRGLVVAMTGDGVNDAPALKIADIGCAMGKNGTEVAKNAADMVLTDDNFSTIVSAVREGRGVTENIRKTVHFLLSSNMGEILVVLAAYLLGLPAPLTAIQLLWVNLVTDSLPALALGADPIRGEEIMRRPPASSRESLFSGGMGRAIVLEGCLVGALSLLAFTIGRVFFDADPALPLIGRTMGFAVLCLSQLTHSFNTRSQGSVVLGPGLFSNQKLNLACLVCAAMLVSVILVPGLRGLFGTAALSLSQWVIVAGLSVFPLFAIETEKRMEEKGLMKRGKEGKKQPDQKS